MKTKNILQKRKTEMENNFLSDLNRLYKKAELREMKAVSKNGKKLWLNITDILHLASEEILEHVGNFIEKEEK